MTTVFRANGVVLDNEWKVEVDAKDGAIDTRVFRSMKIERDPYDQMYKNVSDFVGRVDAVMPTPFRFMMCPFHHPHLLVLLMIILVLS